MKKLIKKYFPAFLLKWYRNRNLKFKNKLISEVFTEIYETNYWKSSESVSGAGSELVQTESLRNNLEKILNDMKISSVLDIPCGDFKWMQQVDLSKIDYIGADIVEKLIQKNIKRNTAFKFIVLDLIKDPLPKSDIIIVRDCLVHLSYSDIFKAINNIKSSGCKYLLTTTFPNCHLNRDITTGDWRTINLQEKPFNFPTPRLIINENCTEGNGEFNDKSMALWEISNI
jgi:hypothetical protein